VHKSLNIKENLVKFNLMEPRLSPSSPQRTVAGAGTKDQKTMRDEEAEARELALAPRS